MEVIAQHGATLLIIAIAFGCFMTWSIGRQRRGECHGRVGRLQGDHRDAGVVHRRGV